MSLSDGGVDSGLIGSTGIPVSQMRAENMNADDLLRAGFGRLLGGNPYYQNDAVGVVPQDILDSQSSLAEIQKNVVAEGDTIPILYGRGQIGGRPIVIDYSDGVWTVAYRIGMGELQAVERTIINGADPVAGVTVNVYLGTTAQVADPLLVAAIDGYADDLVVSTTAGDFGVAYAVIQYGDAQYDAWPRVVFQYLGKKVWNPKTQLLEYTQNSSLHYADFLSSPIYGQGYSVDDASLEQCQDANDDDAFGEVRRCSSVQIDRPQNSETWAEVLRAYASCYKIHRGDVVHLVPDRPVATAASVTQADVLGLPLIATKDSTELPTVIRVIYTNTDGDEWRELPCEPAELPGVSTGAVERREQLVRMTGIDRHSQAYREAVERLNKLHLDDLGVTWIGFDENAVREAGDVVDFTHSLGLSAKPLRLLTDPVQISPGRYRLRAAEYDPAAYSDEIAYAPTYADGNLPNGGVPGAVTGLTVGETTYQLQNGKYASRLDISWAAAANSFTTSFEIMVKEGATVVWAGSTSGLMMSTSPLKELVDYTIEVVAKNAIYSSAAALANYAIIGKTAKPNAPPSITGFEAGGEVRLSWAKALDADAERYEVRYSDTSGAWASAAVIDIVDSLRLATKDVPPSDSNPGGVWRFYVRTIDSIGQQSDDEITIDLAVTLDDNAFRAGGLEPISAHDSLTFMHSVEEVRGSGVTEYYSDGNDTFTSLFGAAAMSTFGNALASYQSAQGTSEWYSEELDLGEDKSGSFQASKAYVNHAGTATVELGLKPDGGSYSWGAMSRQGTARYAQVRIRSAGIFQTSVPEGYIRADVVASSEEGSSMSLSSSGKKITLSKEYSAARSIIITPEGSAARSYSIDNIILDDSGFTSFEVYIFNSSGAQVANDFLWAWKGV